MRILHVADRLTDRGGAYHYLFALIERQIQEHDVELIVGSREPRVSEPCPTRVVPGLDARGRAPVALGDFDRDVVHVHNVVNPEALEQIARLTGVSKRITVQDHRYFCPSRGKWTADGTVCRDAMSPDVCKQCFKDEAYFRRIYALTEARLRALVGFRIEVLSHYMKRELVAVGIADDRIEVMPPSPNGLGDGEARDAARSVLFVGRLVEAKGVWDAVEAWKRSGVELPLVFAGTGPLRNDLEARGFEVLGWLPRHRMVSLYRSAAAVLMPSRWQEPFGIAGLEAQSLGTPVVAWDSGGIAEWHHGPGLVGWGDVDGLARELRAVVEG